jgi:hypothetical protein
VLDVDTLGELWIVKRTLESMRERRTPQNNLERFACQVAGITPAEADDTIPAPPPSGLRVLP